MALQRSEKGELQMTKSEEEAHKPVVIATSASHAIFSSKQQVMFNSVTFYRNRTPSKKSGAFGVLTPSPRHDMMYRT
jgi:hypothetical protein